MNGSGSCKRDKQLLLKDGQSLAYGQLRHVPQHPSKALLLALEMEGSGSQIQALPLPPWVTLGKLLNCSELSFLIRKKKVRTIHLTGRALCGSTSEDSREKGHILPCAGDVRLQPAPPGLTWFLMAFCRSSFPLLVGTCQEEKSREVCSGARLHTDRWSTQALVRSRSPVPREAGHRDS